MKSLTALMTNCGASRITKWLEPVAIMSCRIRQPAIAGLSGVMWTMAAIAVLLPSVAMAFTHRGLTTGSLCMRSRGRRLMNSKRHSRISPRQSRRVIYLQLLGNFAPERSPSIDKLHKFAAAFFAMEVKALPPIKIDNSKFTTRRNPYTGNPQILTGDVLTFLKTCVPADAFCILAITMEDLYPEPSWNFVFGQASLRDRVGVYSSPGTIRHFMANRAHRVMRRCYCAGAGVLAHETGHMFGLAHCTYFNCLMNGSNHLAESDRRPLHLCPVCLRKLQWNIGFDVLERYAALERANRAAAFIDEADWFKRRIKTVHGE
jgi:archaemetzincin